MPNSTGNGNFKSKLDQTDNPSLGILELLLALNIFLSITASLGNSLILVALHRVSSIYPPTKLFFRCLALTDFCVGLVAQPLFATFILLIITEVVKGNISNFVHESYNTLTWILSGVSLLTSAAISVDRLFALLLGLRYRHVVTLTRVRVVLICFWLVTASAGTLRTWSGEIFLIAMSGLFMFSLLVVVFCYTRIRFRLRHRQTRLQNHVSPQAQATGGGIPMNIARYKKSVSSILWVQLALAACYVPWSIVALLFAIGIEETVLAWIVTETLLYLNSSLNPILYCWKIREVRRAVKATIKQLACF